LQRPLAGQSIPTMLDSDTHCRRGMDIANDPTEMKSSSNAATAEFQPKTACGLIVARSAEVRSKMRLRLVNEEPPKYVLAVILSLAAVRKQFPRENSGKDQQSTDYDPCKRCPRCLVTNAGIVAGVRVSELSAEPLIRGFRAAFVQLRHPVLGARLKHPPKICLSILRLAWSRLVSSRVD